MKIIAKICLFVILAVFVAFLLACSTASPKGGSEQPASTYEPPRSVGKIRSDEITEASGLAASKCQPGVLWTHNDSGDGPYIFAINEAGDDLGTWQVTGGRNFDWEDIATYKDAKGRCQIYIGEIGDNKTQRPTHTIYMVEEPIVSELSRGSNRSSALKTGSVAALNFSYPDRNQDAETLMVHPKTGHIYVVTKRVSGPAGIYRLKPTFGTAETQIAESIGELSVPAVPNGFLTGGDISSDGTRLVICDYTQAYEYQLPSDGSDISKALKQVPETIDLGKRKTGEAVCYSVDGSAIFAASEGRNPAVLEIRRK